MIARGSVTTVTFKSHSHENFQQSVPRAELMTERAEEPPTQAIFLEREVNRAIRQKGCPVCRICGEHLEKQMFWFFSEFYAGGSGVSKYIGYWGFCKEHGSVSEFGL